MHVVLDAAGQIEQAGPTLQKICAAHRWPGRGFSTCSSLCARAGRSDAGPLCAMGRQAAAPPYRRPRISLKGTRVALFDNRSLLNLSFGISLVEAIRSFDLTAADFAATDLVTEILFLNEAKSAAMEASRKLTLRLQGARVTAVEQAFTDTLTGLKNRRALEHVLPRLIDSRQDFALLHLDLDFFKQVNDRLGHAAGDHVLCEASERLTRQLRDADLVARVGGDEFVLILHGLTSRTAVMAMAERMIASLEQQIAFQQHICRISASIGATLAHDYDHPAASRMIEDADLALYAAKAAGRGCARMYTAELRQSPSLRDSG